MLMLDTFVLCTRECMGCSLPSPLHFVLVVVGVFDLAYVLACLPSLHRFCIGSRILTRDGLLQKLRSGLRYKWSKL